MSEPKNYVAIARKYREDVRKDKSGKYFGKWERLACERAWRDEQKAKKDKAWPYYFDEWWANDVCDFIEKLPHVEGDWDQPTLTLEPWQIFILTQVFGWRKKVGNRSRPEVDPRRFNTAYIEVARKNGKSALSSGIALYCLLCEGENGPQVKTAATTGDQARIVFDVCRKMVEKTPELAEEFAVQAMANSIVCWGNSGHIKPINAKASTQDGLNPHLNIIDELHAHDSRALFDVLQSAQGARKNPLGWFITTAGYNLNGVCMEQRTYVTKILEQVFNDDTYFSVIYTLDEGDDCFNPANWRKANPNLGVSVQHDYMHRKADLARNSPESEGEFKTKHCNLWLNAANTWLNMSQWDACKSSGLKPEDFAEWDAWIGCDLADKNDIAAAVLVFRRDDVYAAFPRFYLPRDLVKGCAHRTPEYTVWAKQGYLTLTEGDYIDYNQIEQDIRAWCRDFSVRAVGFDQYGSAQIASNLTEDGIKAVIIHKNAASCSDPAKVLENRVKTGKLKHDGHPVYKWMASNVVVTRRVDGSILPKKENQNSPNKIDGIDATVFAIALALQDEGPTYMDEILLV